MKKFFVGALFGAALMVGVTAYADVQGMVGKVVDGVFPVKIEDQTLENEAIVIEGTSYLPVRELAEKVGYEVSFDMEEGIGLKKEELSVEIPTYSAEKPSAESDEKEIPRLEAYNGQIENLDMIINMLDWKVNEMKSKNEDIPSEWLNELEQHKKDKERLKAEREKYYPDWDKSE